MVSVPFFAEKRTKKAALCKGASAHAQASAQKMQTHLEDGASSSFTECGFTAFNPLTGISFSHTPL